MPGTDPIPERFRAEIARFFEDNSRWLFGHARLRAAREPEAGASQESAEDLLQDTFVAAARQWETVRELGEGQQRAWLLTTLSNKGKSQVRRRVALNRKQPELRHRYQPAPVDTERQALSALALARASEVIDRLPGMQRRIALMKWSEHMKHSEIAAVLGCSENSVAVQVSKIRRKLIAGLGAYHPFASDDGGGAG